jgi:hypothetical protein
MPKTGAPKRKAGDARQAVTEPGSRTVNAGCYRMGRAMPRGPPPPPGSLSPRRTGDGGA